MPKASGRAGSGSIRFHFRRVSPCALFTTTCPSGETQCNRLWVRCDVSGTRFSHARARRAVLTVLRRMSSAKRGGMAERATCRARLPSLVASDSGATSPRQWIVRRERAALRPRARVGAHCIGRGRLALSWRALASEPSAGQGSPRRSRAGRGEWVTAVPPRRSLARCARACGHACACEAGWHGG